MSLKNAAPCLSFTVDMILDILAFLHSHLWVLQFFGNLVERQTVLTERSVNAGQLLSAGTIAELLSLVVIIASLGHNSLIQHLTGTG